MRIQDRIDIIRRAFREFLALPSLIIILSLLAAVGAYLFERSQITLYSPLRDFLQARIFIDAQATSELLGTIAGGIITVTSITVTLMLLILQQTATTLSTQVFDQFLRRRSNQIYFGFFIGLALYTLVTLATVDEPFNPILAAALAFVMTVIALYLLIILFYSTIHQMRPPVIIQAIHDHTLSAREHQLELIQRTRREQAYDAPIAHQVFSQADGFVTHINLNPLADLVKEADRACEVVLTVSVGSYVATHDLIAIIKLTELNGIEKLEKMARDAVYLERSRDIDVDPSYGIVQLENIGWTVTSTAKSNPNPGLQVIYSLRDLLVRWAAEEPVPMRDDPLPVVYNDQLLADLLSAFESLAVVASESGEHQVLTEILNSFATQYQRLPEPWLPQIEETLARISPTLERHVLTYNLEKAALRLIEAVEASGSPRLAAYMLDTLQRMRQKTGLDVLRETG